MWPGRSGNANPHHYSVCMISGQYLAQGKGTGVLVEYAGYSCIVAGTHLLPSPVAASKALAHFILPGMPHSVTISLRPKALFEVFGKNKSIAITASDRPIYAASIAIPSAVPAPAEYADTIRRFSRSGRLQSPTEPDVPDSTNADKTMTMPGGLMKVNGTRRHKHTNRRQHSKRHRNHTPGELAIARNRRAAVVPGTTAHRRPNDPDPVEPFAITVEHGGVVVLELVAHHGKNKRAYRTAVLGPRVKQAAAWMDVGGKGLCRSEVQEVMGATGEWKREDGGMEGGTGGGWEVISAALPPGRQDGVPRTGRAGRHSARTKKGSNSDDKGPLSPQFDCTGGERRTVYDDAADESHIAVVVDEEEALDGVHGAPVFLGGQLFGFAIQESVGKHVTGVVLASTFGLLPAPLAAPSSMPTSQRRGPLSDELHNVLEQHDVNRSASLGAPSEEIKGDKMAPEDKKRAGRGKGAITKVFSPPVLLEKVLHLFRHGTPLSLEVELSRVGEEALKALRTPDGRSLVHLAAMSETLVPLEFVHRRLFMDVTFAKVPDTGNTGLHLSAYCGRVACLSYLVSLGGNTAQRNRHGQTPAMLAALTGQTGVLRWLLDHTKDPARDLRGIFPEELFDMVEDMDEAAVYGSPMYRLLEQVERVLSRPASEDSDSSDNGLEDAGPATDEANAAAAQPPMTTAEEATAGGETENMVDFDRAWALYGKGEVDARRVLAVLTRIHGDSMDSWWPFVRVALPPGEARLVQGLEVAKRDIEEARIEAETAAKEEASLPPGPGPGAESVCLQSSTVKYRRDQISAGQFHEEMIRNMKGEGMAEDAVVAKVARGMPEEKAWALMDAHRKWKREERLNKKRFRESTRAKAVSRSRANSGEHSAEQRKDDDSSVATVFSLGGSDDAFSLPPSSHKGTGLDRSVAKYKAGRLSAFELKEILSEAFGSQVDCILPGVLASLPARKRRELARLWHADERKPRQPKYFPRRTSETSGKVEEEGSRNIPRTANFGEASGAATGPATQGEVVAAAATSTRNGRGLAQDEKSHSVERLQKQQQEEQRRQKRVSATAATSGNKKGAKRQPQAGGFGRPGVKAGDNEELVLFVPKANSPFTSRASAWAGVKGDPQENAQEEHARRAEGRGRNGALGGGLGVKNAAANNKASTSGNNGGDDDDGDGDDGKTEAANKRQEKRDSMALDAQRLTSEFAAGRLTAPHFFGAMLEEFGEKRLLTALPEILKILPEDKAAALKIFSAEAGGKAGEGTKARAKEKREARKEKEQQDNQHSNEMDPTQVGEASKHKIAAAKESDPIIQERKKGARKERASTKDDAAKATEEDAQKDGRTKKKTKKKVGDKADVKTSAAALPDQEKKSTTIRAEPGKGKKNLKHTEAGVVAGDDDVEGGELFEMTAVERRRYDNAFSKLSQNGGAISPAKAASTLKKSGLPRDALEKIWEMADVERDERLNKDEWAVAMHLVVCVTAKKLPLPARLPKCLRQASWNPQQPLKEPEQQRQQQGEPAAEKKAGKGETPVKQQEKNPKKKAKGEPSPPVDLKRAAKEFKNGDMEAEEFLPVLQQAFGKKELAKMWPKLLPTLPPEKAGKLAKVAGLNGDETDNSSTETLPQQVRLKEATSSFKKGGMGAMEYHENVLKKAFGKKFPEMLPSILKALPPDRAAALKAVVEAEADEVRRLAEEAPLEWAMSFEDRRVYDNAFVKLDKDQDGFLSSMEARPMLKKALGDRLTESQIGDLWKMADIDGDNRLTREEWATAYHIVRCVIKRGMRLPTTLPVVLGPTAGGRLPSVK